MQIIPVIDLLDGAVVHAKKGERQYYQAIQSLLTHSSKPLDIVAALIEYYPFQKLYIADLNAIQKLTAANKASNNFSVIESIAKHYPNLELWIDAGISNPNDLSQWSQLDSNLILGSENFTNLEQYLSIRKHLDNNCILSLDFMPAGYQGPVELLNDSDHWPKDVIIMSLANVGSNQGINTALVEKLNQHTANFKLYSAGGVRGIDDLSLLKRLGIHGALIATALHLKQLTHQQIASLNQ